MSRATDFAGVCAAMLPPEAGGPDADELARRIHTYVSQLPRTTRMALTTGVRSIDMFARVTSGKRLADLDTAKRVRVLQRIATRGHTNEALEAIKAVVLLVAGGERAAAKFSHDIAKVPIPDDPLHNRVIRASDWPGCTSVDAVVIGSGAGGAMTARCLARSGMSVLILEEGAHHPTRDLHTMSPLERQSELYRECGISFAIGNPVVILPQGRSVGGTTVVNSGTCFRTPDHVIRTWHEECGLALAEPARFGTYLDEVERTLHVTPTQMRVIGGNGQIALRGAHALGWSASPLIRNAPECAGTGQCAWGCPLGVKLGVHLNALPQACEAGATIVSEARAHRLIREGDRIVGVRCRRRDGSWFDIDASIVVVAAGATETPALLRRSRIASHPHIGKHLAVHPAATVAGRFEEAIATGVLQSVGVDEFHEDHGILLEATKTPPGMGASVLPGFGASLVESLEGADTLANLGVMVADKSSGRVVGSTQPLVFYALDRIDMQNLVFGMEKAAQLLFAAGAREVILGLSHQPVVHSHAEAKAVLSGVARHDLHLAGFHPTGTVSAGHDAARHPVDEQGRLRGVSNVWIADASILPACTRVNPQLSIMAMGLAVGDSVTNVMR